MCEESQISSNFFIKSSYKDKLHNRKEKLVVKRNSFSVMSTLMYNIKFHEIENNV